MTSAARSPGPCDNQAIVARLNEIQGRRSIRDLAQGYRTSRETVRRWLLGEGKVPADFIAHACLLTGANPAWVLLGIEPKYGLTFAEGIEQRLADSRSRQAVASAIADLFGFAPAAVGKSAVGQDLGGNSVAGPGHQPDAPSNANANGNSENTALKAHKLHPAHEADSQDPA